MNKLDKLKEILEKHKAWREGLKGEERADLCGADLHGVDLHNADLCEAYLRNADLSSANLSGANLRGACLRNAYLCGSDLSGADLSSTILYDAHLSYVDLHNANLRGAELCSANLFEANLSKADLTNASLCNADLSNANLSDAKGVPFIPMACPDSGSFTAWKKARGYIVKLLVPEDARRSSATGRKCRCDKAIVVAIEKESGEPAGIDVIASDYDVTFVYMVGNTVVEPNFCEDRFKECAEGIHFFVNRQEAVDY